MDNNFNTIIPHKKNPVIIDSRIARNAGKIFYDKHGRLIRPSQINLKEKYGFGINLSKITKLNLSEYSEKVIKSFHYKKSINYSGIHHLDINEDNIIIDKIKNFNEKKSIFTSHFLLRSRSVDIQNYSKIAKRRVNRNNLLRKCAYKQSFIKKNN